MRKFSKILMLVLSLALLVGVVFTVASSALTTSDATTLGITGATRQHEDFTEVDYEAHVYVDGGVAATPAIAKTGSYPLYESISNKYGHIRTIQTPDGNKYVDWTFHADYTSQTGHDSVLGVAEGGKTVQGMSYLVIEFDMTTRTNYPGNIGILIETRVFNSSSGKEYSNSLRMRDDLGSYSASSGEWTFGENTYTFEQGEWVHITLVTQLVPTYSVDSDGVQQVHYGESVTKAYVNGEYASEAKVFNSTSFPVADNYPILHYAGVGYKYNKAHTGRKAGDSVSVDNCTYTKFDTTYAAETENDKLAALFASENPVTDITDLGNEVMFTSEYAYPEEVGLASYVPSEGEEYLAGDFADAYQMLKDDEAEGATIKLYGHQYNPVVLDYPVVVDCNGFNLQGGWEVPPQYIVVYNSETGILTVSEDPEQSATFEYYDVAFDDIEIPVFTQVFAKDRDFVMADFDDIDVSVAVNGNVGIIPEDIKVYNADGEEVTITTITEDHYGQTYYVCPTFRTVTLENDIAFYTVLNNVITFYDSTDLWAAAVAAGEDVGEATSSETDGVVTTTQVTTKTPKYMPDGLKIVLVNDCTISEPLYTAGGVLTIDLNGHAIIASTYFATPAVQNQVVTTTKVGDADATSATAKNYITTNMQIYVYSSVDGGAIDVGASYLLSANFSIGTSNGVDYYFGYENADTVSSGRIAISFGTQIATIQKGSLYSIHFANADIVSTGNDGYGLISMRQSRGYAFTMDNCNLFLENNLVAGVANSNNSTFTITNSNIYGTGDNQIFFIEDYGGTEDNKKGSTCDGTASVYLKNSKIYNMTYGDSKVTGWHTSGQKTAYSKISLDATSMTSCEPELLIDTITGKTLLYKPESVVIDGVTYVTGCQWVAESTKYATFNVYGVTIDELTAQTPIISSMKVAVGSWFAYGKTPEGETVYDPATDAAHAMAPGSYTVYDSEGNPVEQTVLTDADADKVYTVCVGLEKVEIAFSVAYADGTTVPYFDVDLSVALDTTTIDSGTGVVLPEGSTLTLYKDCTTSYRIFGNNSYIDLNGHAFYSTYKVNSFCVLNANLFIYSSADGAKVYQTPTSADGSGYVAQLKGIDSKVYFGYKDETTKSPYTIEVYCGAFAELQGTGTQIHLANLVISTNGRDNYGFLNIRSGSDQTRKVTVEDTVIYLSRGTLFCYRQDTATADLYMKNCTVYSKGSNKILQWYESRETACTGSFYLEDTKLYGNFTADSLVNGTSVATVYVSGDSYVPVISENIKLSDGYIWAQKTETVELAGIEIPASGIYGAKTEIGYAGTYSTAYTPMTLDAFKASAFQNMSLATNVVGNLYVPAYESIASVMLGQTDVLDTTLVEIINGKEYYVLSFDVAPKYGDLSLTLTVNFEDGSSVDFPMSVSNYAKALLALDGESNEYVADSQVMMKYILNYIKEVAVEFGGADAATIFADLGDITVDTDVQITEEVKDTSAVNAYVTHAALDLDAYAGFAFKVAANFVGTIKVELEGVPAVEVTYTAETPASENDVIVLENVPAHLFRGDVVITVTPAEGEVVSATFNLATYASANDAAYIKALYAYTVQAEAYNTKYPTVNTVD